MPLFKNRTCPPVFRFPLYIVQQILAHSFDFFSAFSFHLSKKYKFTVSYFFSERASMFQWMGPKRYRPPACTVDQLPGQYCRCFWPSYFLTLSPAELRGPSNMTSRKFELFWPPSPLCHTLPCTMYNALRTCVTQLQTPSPNCMTSFMLTLFSGWSGLCSVGHRIPILCYWVVY